MRVICIFCVMLAGCGKKERTCSQQIVHVNLQAEPTSLDPRIARDANSSVIIRMLFEGLMRVSEEGLAEPALAKSIVVSEDGLKYVISLRHSLWSDGSDLTAFDFLSTWKMILDPQFASDVAYQLYPIKNAKKIKMGELPFSSLGVNAIDANTIAIELEEPTPYFLELLSMPSYFAVPCHVAEKNENWAHEADTFVCNGPFQIEKWNHADHISLTKNAMYWQSDLVKLDGVDLLVANADTALKMFEEGKLEWMGSPLATIPADAICDLKSDSKLRISTFLATRFCRLNVADAIGDRKNPLANAAFRRSLGLSLDRSSIVEHILKGGQTIATALVPSDMGLSSHGYFPDNRPDLAKEQIDLFKEEMGDVSSTIVISYYNNETNAQIAQTLQRQWQERLGLDVSIEAVEPKVFFQRISKREFQIALGSWTADFNDPINFLEVFKYKDNGTNNTNWENAEYIDLLNRSAVCRDLKERKQILRKAEELLMHEMPIIPIHHFALNYVVNDALTGVLLSPQGFLDFRRAHFMQEKAMR